MTTATAGAVQLVVAGKDAKLELRVMGSVKDGTAAQFEIFKAADDSSITSLDGQVQKGKAITTWSATGPDEAKLARSYRIYYVVTVEGVKTTSPELEVCYDTMDVTSKGEDGAALADMKFLLTVKEGARTKKEVKGSTGSSGTFTVTGLPPGDVTVEWRAPARLIEWTEEKARTRVAKLKKAFKVELVYPKAGDVHKQWVNQPTKADQRDSGSKLKVRVKVHADDGPSRKGDEVFLKLEYPKEGLSKRKEPARGVKGGKVQAWSKPGPGAVQEVAADGGEVEFEVELGKAGGDKVKLHVGGTEACEDAHVEVENWRKVYYQITRPTTLAAPKLDHVGPWMEEAFVVFEALPEVTFTKEESGREFKGTWIKGREVDNPDFRPDQDLFIMGEHNYAFAERKFDTSRGKRALGVTLVDLICDAVDAKGKPLTHTAAGVEVTEAEQEVVLSGAGLLLFPRALHSGEHPFISGTWKTKGGKTRRSGPMTKEMVVISKVGVKAKLQLPKVARDDPGNLLGRDGVTSIVCTIRLHVGLFKFAGVSYGQFLVARRMADDVVFERVLAHELGHNLRQAVSKSTPPPKGVDIGTHKHNYEERGHVGPHCNFGLNDAGATHVKKYNPSSGEVEHVDLSGAASAQPDYQALRKKVGSEYKSVYGTCLMFGEVDTGLTTAPPSVWCEKCLPFVLAQSLEDVST